MLIQKENEAVLIPLELADYMVNIKHRIPTPNEIESLKHYCSTQDDTPWNTSIFKNFVSRSLIIINFKNVDLGIRHHFMLLRSLG
jgi:hypothetical protein